MSIYYLLVLDNMLWGVLQCPQSGRIDAKDTTKCKHGRHKVRDASKMLTISKDKRDAQILAKCPAKPTYKC